MGAKVEILEQAQGPGGKFLTLRRVHGGFEVVTEDSSGKDEQVLLASAARRSERELVNIGLGPLRDRNDITVLLAGLGMGHLLAALLESPRVVRVDVVEYSLPIIDWNRSHLSVLHKEPPLADSRVHVHNQELGEFLRAMRYGAVPGLQLEGEGFLAALLDLDDGPSALYRQENSALYTDDGLSDIEMALRPGGVLALWSARREPELLARMQSRFQNLAEIAVPIDLPSSSGLDYIYRARRRAPLGTRARAQA